MVELGLHGCARIPLVRIDDAQKRGSVVVDAAAKIVVLEGILEVVGFGDLEVTTKCRKARKDDECEDDDLEDTEDVEKAHSSLGKDGVDNGTELSLNEGMI